ncbi:MAG TPA: cytochrome c3 family protein, partial [Gemmata sp.]|nr:cytochrome c3 family protein [Gemmata sp.]
SDQADHDRIQLNCSSCHKLDSEIGTPGNEAARAALAKAGEPARSVLPPRAEGAYFLPVNFEANCRSCHPLHAPAGASAGHVIRGFDLPHRKQYSELKGELEAGYLRSLIQARHESLAAPARPGGALDPRHAIAVRTLSEETSRLARSAERLLLTGASGCAKCHDVLNAEVARVPDRTVWFAKTRFDHTRHKALSCAACHPGAAFAPAGQALAEKEPVQILGIDSCRACHSPSGTRVVLVDGAAARGGGARHGCVDCHRYHNAEHGLQGRGARGLLPRRRLDIAEFLRGGGN